MDNVFLDSTRVELTQREFNVLTDHFKWMSLRTNVRKTVIMVYPPCQSVVDHSA